MIEPNNISYRDTAARVVKKDTGYYRYIFHEYKAEYDHLMSSGLYQKLREKGLLIEHQEIEIDTDDPNVYKLLYPTQIPFQSYPFEWSYSQWRKAILTYLRINHFALKYGMILKDATPYNFYQTGGKAVMFDTSSFMFFKDNDDWIAYRQFCEELLSPLVLMNYKGAKWSKFTMANLRGLPLNFVSKQLPLKSWFNLTTLLHIHLHSKYTGITNQLNKEEIKKKGFTLEKIKSLQSMIFKTVSKWGKAHQYGNHWYGYYENDIECLEYLQDKEATIRKWLKMIKPKSVIDLGANTGKFSFIASEYAERVVALEGDDSCVDAIENHIEEQKINNVFTLIGSLEEPSPNIGLLNSETENIYKRGNSEMVLGLALTHHLHFTDKMSFDQIAELLNKFSRGYVIVEFIEKEDNKVQLLFGDRKVDTENYNESCFVKSIEKYFLVVDTKKLKKTYRVLYLLKKTVL